jgi:hypothetical protein
MVKRRAQRTHEHGPVRRDIPGELPARAREWSPLTTGFLVTSIVGFFVSVLYITKFSLSMAVSFAIVFFCMFLASMISMARASPDAQLAARPIK